MAINNTIKVLSLGLLAALTSTALSSQETSAPIIGVGQEIGVSTAAQRSATMAELPPKAPRVTCKDDQLTISANNSTLGSVLAAVHACVGVQIDIPEGAATSRTFGELGPGPARQVLEALLSGTDFNYVIGSSEANPQKIETVLLMARTNDSTSAASMPLDRALTPSRRAWMQSRQNRGLSLAVNDESHAEADESSAVPEEDVAAPVEQSGAGTTPAAAHDTAASPAADAPPTPAEGAIVASPAAATPETPSITSPSSDSGKSTSERISDMQQLFERRRQMQQGQNPVAPKP